MNRLTRVTRPKALEPVQQQDGSIVTRYERHEYAVLRSVRERKKSMMAKAEGVVQPTAGAGNLKRLPFPGTHARWSRERRARMQVS